MREDQKVMLQEISEQLCDAAILDADPRNWVGYGKAPNELDREERGDAYWCRRQATATISLLIKVRSVVENNGMPGRTGNSNLEIDEDIGKFQSLADEILSRIQKATAKA